MTETTEQKTQNRVLVLDHARQALMPCRPASALLKAGKAAVLRRMPFTIILRDRIGGEVQPTSLKLDPGSKETGIAVVAEFMRGLTVISAAVLKHRGEEIKESLDKRRSLHRGRRNRKTRYRKPRFDNRARHGKRIATPEGEIRLPWLQPSLEHRVHVDTTWGCRLARLTPAGGIVVERVRFDTQLMENPDISGVEYQQGTPWGFEVKEYLLTLHGHSCAYCGGLSGDKRLDVEHVVPRNPARGPRGTDRISNLVIACRACNQAKDNLHPEEWLDALKRSKAKLDKERVRRLPGILAGRKRSLKDAAAVNTTRYALTDSLKAIGPPIETGSGGLTKFNRTSQGYPKTHWIDAACVGESGAMVRLDPAMQVLSIKACARHDRRMVRPNKYGVPSGEPKGPSVSFGFRTGDQVVAVVPKGKRAGRHVGRVAIRSAGSFSISTARGLVQGISWRHRRLVQRTDGYAYIREPNSSPA